jgi:hypothetical protein
VIEIPQTSFFSDLVFVPDSRRSLHPSLWSNTVWVQNSSNINERLSPLQLKVYGDTICPKLSHVRSSSGKNGTGEEKREDKEHAKVRICIEWNCGAAGLLFGYLSKFSKLKLLGSSAVAKLYTVTMILRNCHICLCGSDTSYNNFKIPSDMNSSNS